MDNKIIATNNDIVFFKKDNGDTNIELFMTTSIDYDKNSEEAYTFFKIVQNKLHYAITGHTAAELIYESVDSKK